MGNTFHNSIDLESREQRIAAKAAEVRFLLTPGPRRPSLRRALSPSPAFPPCDNPRRRPVLCLDRPDWGTFCSIREAARRLGISFPNLYQALRANRPCHGLRFAYADAVGAAVPPAPGGVA